LQGLFSRSEDDVEALARFVVHLAELLEAEGRAVRASVLGVLTAAAMLLLAAAVGMGGVALIFVGLYCAVRPVGAAWASVITGLTALMVGGGLLWIARRMDR
jgi:hypothetical protein